MKVSLNSSVYTTYINKNFKWKPANSDPDLSNRYMSPHQFHVCLNRNFLSGRTEYLELSLPTQQHGYSSLFSTFILSQAALYSKVSASLSTALCGPSTPVATWEAGIAESLKSGEGQHMQQQTRCVTQEAMSVKTWWTRVVVLCPPKYSQIQKHMNIHIPFNYFTKVSQIKTQTQGTRVIKHII